LATSTRGLSRPPAIDQSPLTPLHSQYTVGCSYYCLWQGSQRAWEILENAWIWNKKFKALESAWKQIRCFESTWKSLKSSCICWQFWSRQLYACHQYLETVFDFTLFASASRCSLNFEYRRLGCGLLSIILVLEKCNLGPRKSLKSAQIL